MPAETLQKPANQKGFQTVCGHVILNDPVFYPQTKH